MEIVENFQNLSGNFENFSLIRLPSLFDRKTGFQASPLQGDFFYATVLMSSFSTSNAGF